MEENKLLPPKHVRALLLEDWRVRLWWDFSESEDVAEYRIYLGKDGEFNFNSPIDVVPAATQQWTAPHPWLWDLEKQAGLSRPKGNCFAKDDLGYLSPLARYSFVVEAIDSEGNTVRSPEAARVPAFVEFKSLNNILSAAVDDDSRIWFGTSGGVLIYDPKKESWETITPTQGLAGWQVHCISIDREGKVWIGTDQGVSCFDGNEWKTFLKKEGLPGDFVRTITEDKQGRIWFGTWGGGVKCFDGKSWKTYTWEEGLGIDDVLAITEDKQGRLWFGTSEGVSCFDGRSWKNYTTKEGLANNYVRAITEDKQGRLWFGTWEGVSCFDGRSWKNYTTKEGLANNYVLAITEDKQGRLWFGTWGRASCFDGRSWKSYTLEEGLVNNYVLAITEDKQGRLWFGTSGGGLLGILWHTALAHRVKYNINDLVPQLYYLLQHCENFSEAVSGLAIISKQIINSGVSASLSLLVEALANADLEKAALDYSSAFIKLGDLPWAGEIAELYAWLAKALSVRTMEQIARLASELSKLSRLYKQNCPIPGIVSPLLTLQNICNLAIGLTKIDVGVDKVAYLARMVEDLAQLRPMAESELIEPERRIFLELATRWLDAVKVELEELRGRPRLSLSLKARRVIQTDRLLVPVTLQNAGAGPAEKVVVRLLRQPSYIPVDGEKHWEYIRPNGTCEVVFELEARQKGKLRLEFEVRYKDLDDRAYAEHFADTLSLMGKPRAFTYVRNPYQAGLPLEPDSTLFIGRSETLEFFETMLEQSTERCVLILVGERRMGKTSVLHRMRKCLVGNHMVCIANLQGYATPGLGSLLYYLGKSISNTALEYGLPIDPPDEAELKRSPETFFDWLRRIAKENTNHRQLVLALDEFEILDERIRAGELEPKTLPFLRHLAQFTPNTSFIFSGTHEIEELGNDYWSILFNIGPYCRLGPLSEAETRELIMRPLSGHVDVFDDLLIDKIVKLSGGHPYYTQLVCFMLMNYRNTRRIPTLTIQDLRDQSEELVRQGNPHFSFIWDCSNPRERIGMVLVYQRVSRGDLVTAELLAEDLQNEMRLMHINVGSIREALHRLTRRFILKAADESKTTASYRFAAELYQLWIEVYKRRALYEENLTW